MDMDVGRQRRNLIAVSVALILYNALDAELNKVSVWNGGMTVSGSNAVYLAVISAIYMLWRYWLYVRDEHRVVSKQIERYIIDSDFARSSWRRLKLEFIKANNITDWREYIDNPRHDVFRYTLNGESFNMRKSFFFCRFDFWATANHENSLSQCFSERVGFFRYTVILAKSSFSVIFTKKEFSDLYVPYFLAGIALVWTGISTL